MPEVTIKFNLPEDQSEFNTYSNSHKYWHCLNDLRNYFRQKLKYDDNLSDSEYQSIEKVSEEFYSILNNNTVNLDD